MLTLLALLACQTVEESGPVAELDVPSVVLVEAPAVQEEEEAAGLGLPQPEGPTFWFADRDGDGFGDDHDVFVNREAPVGFVLQAGDCDDQDARVQPGVRDDCDGVDSDCDGLLDEDGVFWQDLDGDGFGSIPVPGCEASEGLSDRGGDCNDDDALTTPGLAEVCDGFDDNCDGQIDEGASCGCDIRTLHGASLMVCDLPLSWDEAEASCAEVGYHLLDIQDAQSNAEVRAIAANYQLGNWWTGLNEEDARWQWVDGSAPTWSDWPASGPMILDGARCGTLNTDPELVSSWSVDLCEKSRPFLCIAR